MSPRREVAAYFTRLGIVAFGGPAAHIAMMRYEVVRRRRWVSDEQFLDLLGITNLIPGTNAASARMPATAGGRAATFIGFLLGGFPGAVLATVAIFLPSFVFVALSRPWLPRLRASPRAAGFLDGVNVAALGLMAAVAWQLGRAAIIRSAHRRARARRGGAPAHDAGEFGVLIAAGGIVGVAWRLLHV